MARVSKFQCTSSDLCINLLDFNPQKTPTKYKATISTSDNFTNHQPIIVTIHNLERSKFKNGQILKTFSQISMCPGVKENVVLPLMSNYKNSNFALVMFFIEMLDQNVVYRSRDCDLATMEEGKDLCSSCFDLFSSLELDIKVNEVEYESKAEDKQERIILEDSDDHYFLEESFREEYVEFPQPEQTISTPIQKQISDKLFSKYACSVCSKVLKNEKNLAYHLNKSHNVEYFKECPFCEETIKISESLEQLFNHLKSVHKLESETGKHNKDYLEIVKQYSLEKGCCQICGKQFVSKKNLKEHFECVHLKIRNYKCEHCDKSFTGPQKLKNHMMAVHTMEKPVSCEISDYRCSRSDTLRAHRRNFHNEQQIESLELDMKVKNEVESETKDNRDRVIFVESEDHHLLEESFGEEYVEEVPHPEQSKSASTIEQIPDKTSTKYTCTVCLKVLQNERNLASHFKKTHKVEYFKKCPFCDVKIKIGDSLEDLFNHIRSVHELQRETDKYNVEYQEIVKQFSQEKGCCQFCGKICTSRTNLHLHMVQKHDAPQFKTCHVCGKIIQDAFGISLRLHMQSHVTEEAVCPQCGVSLKNKKYLLNHMKTHNENPFPCETCGKQFFTKRNLKVHVECVHLKIRTFKCEHCDKSFPGSQKLKNHIMAVHTMEKPFSCEMCEYKCSRSDSLRAHRRNVHNEPSASDI